MLKKILIPVVVAATFDLVAPEQADASPISPVSTQNFYGPRIRIGGGISFPIGRRSRVRTVQSGYWRTVYETRVDKVWQSPEHIGFDAHGQPVYSRGHYEYVEVQVPVRVWVPYVTTRYVRHRPAGYISVGGSIRLR